MTCDVPRRVATHNAGKGARSVKALGLPVRLVHVEECSSRSAALKRECVIKKFSKNEKENLVMHKPNLVKELLKAYDRVITCPLKPKTIICTVCGCVVSEHSENKPCTHLLELVKG
jgi:putative endonuclease